MSSGTALLVYCVPIECHVHAVKYLDVCFSGRRDVQTIRCGWQLPGNSAALRELTGLMVIPARSSKPSDVTRSVLSAVQRYSSPLASVGLVLLPDLAIASLLTSPPALASTYSLVTYSLPLE